MYLLLLLAFSRLHTLLLSLWRYSTAFLDAVDVALDRLAVAADTTSGSRVAALARERQQQQQAMNARTPEERRELQGLIERRMREAAESGVLTLSDVATEEVQDVDVSEVEKNGTAIEKKNTDLDSESLASSSSLVTIEEDVLSAEEEASLVCPIAFSVFRDPVIIGSGNTFERAMIKRYFQSLLKKDAPLRDPLTNEILPCSLILTNWDKRRQVLRFLERKRKERGAEYAPSGWAGETELEKVAESLDDAVGGTSSLRNPSSRGEVAVSVLESLREFWEAIVEVHRAFFEDVVEGVLSNVGRSQQNRNDSESLVVQQHNAETAAQSDDVPVRRLRPSVRVRLLLTLWVCFFMGMGGAHFTATRGTSNSDTVVRRGKFFMARRKTVAEESDYVDAVLKENYSKPDLLASSFVEGDLDEIVAEETNSCKSKSDFLDVIASDPPLKNVNGTDSASESSSQKPDTSSFKQLLRTLSADRRYVAQQRNSLEKPVKKNFLKSGAKQSFSVDEELPLPLEYAGTLAARELLSDPFHPLLLVNPSHFVYHLLETNRDRVSVLHMGLSFLSAGAELPGIGEDESPFSPTLIRHLQEVITKDVSRLLQCRGFLDLGGDCGGFRDIGALLREERRSEEEKDNLWVDVQSRVLAHALLVLEKIPKRKKPLSGSVHRFLNETAEEFLSRRGGVMSSFSNEEDLGSGEGVSVESLRKLLRRVRHGLVEV